jgi:hypothetical protein
MLTQSPEITSPWHCAAAVCHRGISKILELYIKSPLLLGVRAGKAGAVGAACGHDAVFAPLESWALILSSSISISACLSLPISLSNRIAKRFVPGSAVF